MEQNRYGFSRMEVCAWLFTLTYLAAVVWVSTQLLLP